MIHSNNPTQSSICFRRLVKTFLSVVRLHFIFNKMSRQRTLFTILPNEIIYDIFCFLSTNDIVRAFSNLNNRYNALIRAHVKSIDLTVGWRGTRQDLQWICETIQILKINQLHLWLVDHCQFFQLHSLELQNVLKWNNFISTMNLTSLSLQFNNKLHSDRDEITIPLDVIRFCVNSNIDTLHRNLIDLNIEVGSMVSLLGIIKHTPLLERLSVTFAGRFTNHDQRHMDLMVEDFQPLNKLNHLSLSTKPTSTTFMNGHLSFQHIQLFVNIYCPNEKILKRIILQLYHIDIEEEMWSTIERYKNTFDRFDFYGLFNMNEQIIQLVEELVRTTYFDYYNQTADQLYGEYRLVHVYSLPFRFDKIYNFTSCSELNPHTSFASVRHLYFSESYKNHLISFQSLSERMPNLISINCHVNVDHDVNIIVPKLIIDGNLFSSVRSLRFIAICTGEKCNCYSLLGRLLDHMPCLEDLKTSEGVCLLEHKPILILKRLIKSRCDLRCVHTLVKYLPRLKILSIGRLRGSPKEISKYIAPLFIRLSSFMSIFFEFVILNKFYPTTNKINIEETLTLMKRKYHSLNYIKFELIGTVVRFYRVNS
ncbi:hypothetical protein I4U23_015955 [Adineta vaga]|nr:hypothetical protein I4U23_015955 [Adineta vaga]